MELEKPYDFFHELKPICILDWNHHQIMDDLYLANHKSNKGHYQKMSISGWGFKADGKSYTDHSDWIRNINKADHNLRAADIEIWPSTICERIMGKAQQLFGPSTNTNPIYYRSFFHMSPSEFQ